VGRIERAAIVLPEQTLALLRPLGALGSRRESSDKRVGGKAAALARWTRDGMRVPPGWVIDARIFERVMEATLPKDHDVASLLKIESTKLGIDRAARARERILGSTLPDDLREAIALLWKTAEPYASWGFAVRSSATCEDAERTSLAGLAETVLGARGPQALEDAVRQVWASLYLPRTLRYLRRAHVRDAAMPVILQLMIESEAAGVAFSRDPLALPPCGKDEPQQEAEGADDVVIAVTLGLGAPVVDGAIATDLVRLSRAGVVVDETIAAKSKRLIVGARGLQTEEVPAARAALPALDDDALRALGSLVRTLEERTEHPMDVEFAVDRDESGAARIWLLQARPVTLGRALPDGGDATTVWSRANVGEALPGAATPLTWSIARGFADVGFREAFEALGCKVPKDAVLVGSVHGRFYLNLTAFSRIAAQVPMMTPSALLDASGGASAAVVRLLDKQVEGISKRGFFLRAPLVAPRLLARQARLEREIALFEPWADKQRRRVLEMDLGILPDDGLVTTLRGTQAMLERTGTLMLLAASASLAAHVLLVTTLGRVMRRSSARDNDAAAIGARRATAGKLSLALTGGVSDLASAAPGIALSRIAKLARTDDEARDALLEGRAKRLEDLPRGATRAALLEFMESYGERAVREAELSVPRWNEDSSQVIAMLTASLHGTESRGGEAAVARARAFADREMARLETTTSALELAVVRALVSRVQHFTRLRERLRFWVTRVLGMLRKAALEIDRRIVRIDRTLPAGAVFFCTFDELCIALKSGRAELGHVVRLRRAEHARDAARPDPPITFVGRPPPFGAPPSGGDRLVGLPASGGVVEGTVRVFTSNEHLDTLEPGEILVAQTADVGLTPLFLVAAGVVTELGGPLSHAAIVAREYGVPAVVSVDGATRALRTGDRVRVDGDRGIVEILRVPDAT